MDEEELKRHLNHSAEKTRSKLKAEQIARYSAAMPMNVPQPRKAVATGGASPARAAIPRSSAPRQREQSTPSYKSFSASELYCPNCKSAMRVREKLLLVLPSGDLYDYVCVKCGTSLGSKTTNG